MKALLIEGYRTFPHSYALVAQSHCLSLLRRGGFDLRFTDLPPPKPHWQIAHGILDPDEELAIAAIAAPDDGFMPQATLTYKVDFTPPRQGRRFTFGTAEYRVLRPRQIVGVESGFAVAR